MPDLRAPEIQIFWLLRNINDPEEIPKLHRAMKKIEIL